ncbi:IclR family transcriptional regulator [Rothia halotolerans]|uniref:IclR family transcriptional regulator n=1 Tax=Rothia halotolerans TaxID=405770 RepID=UPI00101CD78B|nr:IclR family transcriptional regulator [Rothia halotolerans]
MAVPERDPAPAVTRALRALTVLAESRGAPMTLSELARALGIAKSSAANVCAALEEGRMIERVPGGYRLGRRTAELGGAFALQFNQIREFFSVCAASEPLRRELVQIAMLEGRDALYLARHEGRGQERLGTPLGSRLPAEQTATGRAALMSFTDEQIRERFRAGGLRRLTPSSLATAEELVDVVAEARGRGYALDRSASLEGIVGVAVPLPPWAPGDPPLAIGVALPAASADEASMARVREGLHDAVAELTNPMAHDGGGSRA